MLAIVPWYVDIQPIGIFHKKIFCAYSMLIDLIYGGTRCNYSLVKVKRVVVIATAHSVANFLTHCPVGILL